MNFEDSSQSPHRNTVKLAPATPAGSSKKESSDSKRKAKNTKNMSLEEFTNRINPQNIQVTVVKYDKRLFGHSVSTQTSITETTIVAAHFFLLINFFMV